MERKSEKFRENHRKSEKNRENQRNLEKIGEFKRKSEKIGELSVNFWDFSQELSVNFCAYL